MSVPVNKTCSTPDCGQPAVAWYNYGNGEQWACVTHNPFRNMTVGPPPGRRRERRAGSVLRGAAG